MVCFVRLESGRFQEVSWTHLQHKLTFEGHAMSNNDLYLHFPCLQITLSSRSRIGFRRFGVLHEPFFYYR